MGDSRKDMEGERYGGVVIPTALYSYGSELWALGVQEKRKFKIFGMKCLRSKCDVRRSDRVRNSLMRWRCGCELSILKRMDWNVLK